MRSSNENGTLPQSTPTEVDEPQPIGNSVFGKVYNQFKGKVKEAVNFLMRHKSGKLLGVFHRNDIGEISLVWGDEKGGLAHIISKHIVEQNDFNNIDEVINTMQQVINNGTITRENKDKVVIDYNDYRVAIRKQTRDNNGNVVEQGNWVVTAFDKSRSKKDKTPSEKTLSTPPFNQETDGVTLPSNGVTADKVTQSSQTKETKEDKFSPTPRKDGESITDYAERVAEEHQAQRTRKEEEAKVDTNPTDAQKEAGNYKKGHIKVDGLNITIEQPKGSIRRGTDANGKQWESEMHNTYGYIRGTESVDGDHIDIFLSDNPTEGKVFVVDQINKDGSFDEHKVMYGFSDMESARQAYLSNYEEGWQGLGNITEVSKEDFKKWIDSSKRKTKPFAKYSTVKTQDDTQTKKPTEENAAPANTETNENYAHNSEEIMHEQKNVQLQQAINAYENATKFYYQQLKEGKLDKVFESKQWKDVLRKQTELQKVLLQLNSEELKELLKQTTNEDTKKEIKGALGAVLRQEQRSIEYNAVLDKQEPITPIYKEEKKSIAVTEFVETDKKEAEIHPVLTGVYHDNGYVVGTNAHILLARKEDYNKSLEGKITNKKGEVIDGKYPNWRAVVEGETTTNSWGINLDKLHAFVRGVLTKLKADGAKKSTIDSATIAFKDTDGKIIVCNAKTLDKALRGAKSIGATEFGNTSETFAHAQTKKGYVVCPTISTYHSINDNCFVYGTKEAARQQTTATLTNDTEAKQKATEAVLAALSKAGIEVVQATDEQAQAMLANEIGAEKQVVYHGSRAKFKNFDHSHMGEGEGQQAYGWGSYVTEVESIGRTYATGNGKIKFRGFVLEAMHSLEVKEHFSGAERKVLNFLHKWIKRSNNASTAIEKVKEWASNEYEKYSGRRNWSDQDYKDYFGAISKRDVREWRKEMEEKEENAQQMLSFIETLSVDDFSFTQRHLYTVDIPDDTGSNYLNWEQPMSDEQLDAIEEYLKENYRASRVKIFTDGIAKSNSSNAQEVDAFTRQGKNIYHLLEHTIGDDKSVSEMLGSLGYTGISYPAQYQSGGRADNARNYVIFNEKDLKITDHIQFMRTPQGTIYGWSVNGKIYLTEAGINPDTPIHEYTHLWAEAMMIKNKKGWDSIKSLLKDTPVWKEVIADPNYSNIKDNEDAVASEVLSRISGKKNAAKMEEEAQRAIDEAKGVFEKAEATTILLNLKRAIKQFWHWVGKNVFGIKDFKNIDEVTDRILYDLLNNTKLNSGTVTTVDGVSLPSRINVVEAEANHGFKNFDDGRKWAKENIARTYDNEETNGKGNIRISNTAIDKFMSEKAVAKSESKDVHMAVLKVLPDIIRESVDAEQHEDRIKDENGIRKAGNTVNPDVMIHRLYGAVDIAGKIYRVKVTLKENVRTKETSKAYSYEATKIELLSGQSGDVTMTSPRNDNNSILTAKLLKDIEKSYGKGVKLLKDDKSSDPRFQIVGNSLSDEEKKIVETAKANDTYMKAPNGKPTNLSEKQWAQVRTTAFKNWFGDWEKAARIEKLRRSKAVKITGEEIEPNSDLKQYKKNALEYGKNLRGEYTNKDTGETIALTGGNSRGGMREILQHDYKDIEHLQSIAAIPQIIEKAIFVDEAPNEDAERYPGVKSFRYYVCGLKIGNTYYTVKAVVAVQNNGDRYYDHKLSSIEKGKLLSIIPTIQKAGIENNLPPSVGKDKRLLSILQTNSSKVVDENGEPMVVYHGSNNEFTKFDTARIGSSTGTSDGRGFYFTTDKDYANSFGKDGNVLSVFLNIDNPLSLKEKTITKRQLFDIIKRIDEKEVAADGEHWLISNYANYYDVGIDGAIREAAESEYPYSDNDVELVNSLISASGNFKDVVSSVYEITGKSSEIVPKENGTVHYVVTNPNQIKSATSNNGNFSTTEDDILYRTVFGGNSGYVGYSMSKRAAEAKEEGRYPKTEFRREYHITAKSLDMLTSLGFIDNSEWHHTSMYGNKTPFYGWAEDELADDYLKHKKEIDTLCKGIDPKTKQPLIEKVEKPQYEYKFELPQYNEAATAANPIIEWRHKQIEKYDQFTGFKGYAYETKEKKKERDAFLHSLNEQMEEKIREMLAKDYPDYLAAKNAIEAYNNYDENLRKAIGERIKEYLDIDKYSQRWREQTTTTQPTANTETLTNHAESVVQNLHLNNVEIVPDGSSLNGEQATAKGFYNKRTGKIVVVVSNHTDIADIEKTVLHEAVAHHGLRELFGDNFDNFLDTVFAKADIETRQQIAHLSAKHGWNIRTATEEYLASMAEDTNFEQIKPTLWQRIKQLFGEIMSAFGLHHANITDNDLRYILWRSYKNLQSSGKHSILDKVEDIAMQYRLKAGNYADKATDNVLYRSGIDPTATEVLPDARTRYEKETKEPDNIGSVPKTHNFFRRFYKSYVDSMLALKSFTNSVLEATGDKMASHEDTYKAENAMTSKNKTDGEVYNPLFPYMPLYIYM
ncbi:LPD3 domain-containing protein [Prevotella pallens]